MKTILHLLCAALLLIGGPVLAEKPSRLLLSGPMSAVSNPLIHMVESGALAEIGRAHV